MKTIPTQQVCSECLGLGGRMSRYGPPMHKLPDGRLSGWTIGGKKDCARCKGTGFRKTRRRMPEVEKA